MDERVIRIDLSVPDGKSFSLEVPVAILGYEVIDQLIEYEILSPPHHYYNNYCLWVEGRDCHMIDMNATFEENGICENDRLRCLVCSGPG